MDFEELAEYPIIVKTKEFEKIDEPKADLSKPRSSQMLKASSILK